MSMNEQMNHAEESILHTYNRFPVMFDMERDVTSMTQRERNILISQQELQ